jgi:flap endonuclease-1
VRNLAITGRRKLPGKSQYVEIKPEVIELDKLLSALGIDREGLVLLGLLLGTDFNPGGVKGIGPKTALRYVKASRDHVKLLKTLAGGEDLVEAYRFFLEPPVTDDYKIEYRQPDEARIRDLLVAEHDFNPERVDNAIQRLKKAYRENLRATQKRLDAWFG